MKQVKKTKRSPATREEAIRANGSNRKRRRKRRYTLYYILVAVLFITVGISLSLTVFFNIETISVETPGRYTQQEIAEACGAEIGDNLVRTEMGKVEQNVLNQCIYLDSVYADRSFPATLVIVCTPAEIAYSCQAPDGTYSYLSFAGRVLEVGQPSAAPNTTVLSGFEFEQMQQGDYADLSGTSVQELKLIRDKANEVGLNDITGIEIKGANSADVIYQDRITIQVDNIGDADYILQAAEKIIHQYIGPTEHGTIFRESKEQTFHFLPNF